MSQGFCCRCSHVLVLYCVKSNLQFQIFIFSLGHTIDMDPSFFPLLQTTLLETITYPHTKGLLKMMFLFPRWDMLIPQEGNHPWILHVGYRHSWQPDVIRILQVGMLGDWWRLPWVEGSLRGVITVGIPRKRAPDSWGIFWSYSFLDVLFEF